MLAWGMVAGVTVQLDMQLQQCCLFTTHYLVVTAVTLCCAAAWPKLQV
jgi:hypothetical protein